MLKKCSIILFVFFVLASPVIAGDFTFAFEWGDDYPRCKGNYSNSVPSPRFC